VIPVAVRDVNRGQVLSATGEPVGERAGLLDGHERIHQDGITDTMNQR
jgi:hypothetical protein